MTTTQRPTGFSRRSDARRPIIVWSARAALLALLFIGAPGAQVQAGGHRARLSVDLAAQLADASDAPARVIVHGSRRQVQALAARYGARVVRELTSGGVLEVSGGQLDALSQDSEVDHLSTDAPVYRLMAVTTVATGADQAWAGLESLAGVSGRGVGVAVIDSGIDPHARLGKRVVVSVDFTGPNGRATDKYGHGTHVAGIIAGAGSEFSGMAPGAHLANLKVLDADGVGYTSDVVEAIDWTIANRDRFRIRVINLSLGHPVIETYRDDPLCEAVERAVAAGILVVAAAGNYGKTEDGTPIIGGITSPGNSPWALTVGALNTKATPQRSDDVVATYSSRGPTYLDGVLKPDVVAPGNRIVSLAAPGSTLWREYPELRTPGVDSGHYFQLSGTSMAAAAVSGAAALLLQANPSLTPLDVRLALQLTSTFLPDAGLIQGGAGSVNVAAAVDVTDGAFSGSTIIATESIEASGVAFGPYPDEPSAQTLIWGKTLIWAQTLIWGKTLIWGSGAPAASTLIWGKTLIWGNTLIWGKTLTWGNTLIWGKTLIGGKTLIWGSTLIWGNTLSGNTLIWGKTLIWGSTLIWGNSVVAGE